MFRFRPPWLRVAVAGAALSVALESIVLQRKYATFTGGYLQPWFLQGAQIPVFFVLSLLLDTAAVALFAPLALRAVRGFQSAPRRFVAATFLAAAPLVGCMLTSLGVLQFVVDFVAFHAGWSDAVAWTAVAGILVGGPLGATWLAGFLPWPAREPTAGRGWRTLAGCAGLCAAALVAFAVTGATSQGLQDQLRRTTSGRWVAYAGRWLTDFDRDGWDWTRAPFDAAPFDARIHPFAVDYPGNGLDENGINGDLQEPGEFPEEEFPPVRFVRRPDVILFVLETFRYDNLADEVDGKAAAPVLRGIRDAGAVFGPAYSHNGFTVESLVHVMTGSLSQTVKTNLIDDFRDNGYATAVVSGQDETFGDVGQKAGMVRAEFFTDARDDRDLRYTASSASSSLAVPCTVVADNVERLLERLRNDDRPLFVYVNFQDCHFPYHHDKLAPMLAGDPVTRSEIVPANAARVKRTYLNTVANVDAAVGRVLTAWERVRGTAPAFVLVGDHGESFFHDGMLGHGIDLVGEQMRIPFLARGLPVACTFPLGLSEVRRTVRDALARAEDTARTSTDPDKWIFQHTGPIGAPRRLGASSIEGGVVFDMQPRTWRTWGRPAPGLGPPFPTLLTRWEQILLRRAGGRDP